MSEQDHLIRQLEKQGIYRQEVLAAIKAVKRQDFVLSQDKSRAYDNTALPIECKQTISQPYIVALMTQALIIHQPTPKRILEIGTGSGYQTAILARLFKEVYTIERIAELSKKAEKNLRPEFDNIHFKLGDGTKGWPEKAPFDGIIVTAAAKEIPEELLSELGENGMMIIPIGRVHHIQKLTIITKQNHALVTTSLEDVSFVPLIND